MPLVLLGRGMFYQLADTFLMKFSSIFRCALNVILMLWRYCSWRYVV